VHVTAIVAAGGQGVRLGAARPKQLVDLAGTTLLELSVAALAAAESVQDLVVVLPREAAARPPSFLTRQAKPVRVVEGGARRQDSVARGFAALDDRTTLVVVHDAARPFVTADLIRRTVAAAARVGAAIAAVPARDTVKQAAPTRPGGPRVVGRTLDREGIYLAQTPQAFDRDVLGRALRSVQAVEATDEAMLVELAGDAVELVEGDPRNIKVTTPADFAEAERRLLESRRAAESGRELAIPFRIGTGYDLHRLTPGRPLVLGGVRVPFDRGLDGHSDADLVCHAVTDAVLGAVGEGDIGRLFPDDDARWKDADSLALLRAAMALVLGRGFRVGNVDVTVIAQQPRLLPFLAEMRANLAAALGCDVTAVSIKGKTNEGVDSMGRGESMACHAVVLLCSD
jgi:2-C-methyl-D-erythritol 4-phosphate cytidylyltransferase/2-C-methyl-D-erythritol 2,4-cyclodiphosphate synthase